MANKRRVRENIGNGADHGSTGRQTAYDSILAHGSDLTEADSLSADLVAACWDGRLDDADVKKVRLR